MRKFHQSLIFGFVLLQTTYSLNGSLLQAKKLELLQTALVSGRGQWANDKEKDSLYELVTSLEETASSLMISERNISEDEEEAKMPILFDGCWELIASDLEPFRISTFFLALASRVESNIRKGASTPALSVHRLATSVSEVERAAWYVSKGSLKSFVQLKVGSVPSIPLALDGVVVSSGLIQSTDIDDATATTKSRWSVTLENTSVVRNKVLYGLPRETGLTPFSNDEALKFISNQIAPSGDIFRNVLDEEPVAIIDVTLVDDDMLIARVPELDPKSYFVFAKSNPKTEPWQDVLNEIEEQSGQQSNSLLGSAAALGMLNPFFSRRARGSS